MNNIIFLLTGAVLLAGLLYSLIRALRRSLPPAASKADEQTVISIYQNRLQLAEQQFENGELDRQEYEQARQELSTALAYELQNQAQKGAPLKSKSAGPVAWVLAICIPSLALLLYLLLGTPKGLDPAAETAQLSIPEMVARLEKRLKSNPEDIQGWRMLGRSYSVLQNYAGARDAYGEAYKRDPANTAIILDYAEALAHANNNNVLGRPAELIEEALQRDPANQRALILKGVVLYHQDDLTGAIRAWKSVMGQPEVDEQTRAVVQNLIDQTEELKDPVSSGQAQTESQTVNKPAAAAASVTVELSLAPQFTAQVSPNDTVFIFAQAASGPKMPLAVARKRVADLPLKIVLDDSSAMTQGMNLSAFNQVVVSARVSKSGNASAASGDLQGKSPVIDPRANPAVNLVIDTKIP